MALLRQEHGPRCAREKRYEDLVIFLTNGMIHVPKDFPQARGLKTFYKFATARIWSLWCLGNSYQEPCQRDQRQGRSFQTSLSSEREARTIKEIERESHVESERDREAESMKDIK